MWCKNQTQKRSKNEHKMLLMLWKYLMLVNKLSVDCEKVASIFKFLWESVWQEDKLTIWIKQIGRIEYIGHYHCRKVVLAISNWAHQIRCIYLLQKVPQFKYVKTHDNSHHQLQTSHSLVLLLYKKADKIPWRCVIIN